MLPEETLLREILYVMGPGSKHRVWIYNDIKNTVLQLQDIIHLLSVLIHDTGSRITNSLEITAIIERRYASLSWYP